VVPPPVPVQVADARLAAIEVAPAGLGEYDCLVEAAHQEVTQRPPWGRVPAGRSRWWPRRHGDEASMDAELRSADGA
jgi:hypothetical protein